MKRRSTIPRAERDDVPALPPLDGDVDADELPVPTLGDAPSFDERIGDADDADVALPMTGFEPMPEHDEHAGWLEGADESRDLDVGGLDDAGSEHDASWVESANDAVPNATGDVLDDDPVPPFASLDDGEDGPEGEGTETPDEPPPLAVEDADDEPPLDAFDALAVGATHEPPRAWTLAAPAAVAHAPVRADGAVLAAVLAGEPARVVLVGEHVWTLPLATREALDGRARSARRSALGTPGELFTSVVSLGGRTLVAATSRGRVMRSEDGGAQWDAVASLGGDDDRVGIELWTDASASERVWARAHAGGLFRSDDGGRRWDGPVVPQPVRAVAHDATGAALYAFTSGWPPAVLRVGPDGVFAPAGALRLRQPATLAACRRDVWALAFAKGPGLVTVDGGQTASEWPLLECATALALVETDDGAAQLLAAIHDDALDRATLVAAGIDRAGRPRGARRWFDVAPASARKERDADEPEQRVEAIVPLDVAGRRVLLVSGAGVLVVERT